MKMENKTIAVIGASANREKYGNIAVRAYKDQGYTVYPVNPREQTIEDLPCYPSLLAIPGPVETVSVYLPPRYTLKALDDIAAKGVKTVFLNPGTESEVVLRRAEELGLHVVQACSVLAAGKTPGAYRNI
ncbi:MAG: CoA-binding protein [Candidatus Omnitrophota bacterium]|jgi:predicted CoA-binding protein|nr:MAG: CoA-binding protein [Candidatus Omnitrophota bacterium]